MSNPSFNAAADIAGTRAAFGKRLGEIIAAVIGDSRVRELFDKTGKHPDEYKGKSTGDAALDLKVITPATKDALLIAQAAERTWIAAEKTEKLAVGHWDSIKNKQQANVADFISEEDPVFKFVGSPRDSETLQHAQGTWMAAQMLLNHEIRSINGHIQSSAFAGNALTQGPEAAYGFKRAAARLYGQAASMLEAEGHGEAAIKLKAVSKNLADQAPKGGPEPHQVMINLDNDVGSGGHAMFVALNDPRYAEQQPIQVVYERLKNLSTPPEKRAKPTPGSSAKPAA